MEQIHEPIELVIPPQEEWEAAGFTIEQRAVLEKRNDGIYFPNGTILSADGDAIEAHRDDDPDVYGLKDVARGRTPDYPVTVHAVSGDSASGILGRLLPSSEFIPKAVSQVGKTVLVRTVADVDEEFEVVWDGVERAHTEGFRARQWAQPDRVVALPVYRPQEKKAA